MASRGALLGAIEIADRIRPEPRSALATIHGMGARTVLLTGDALAAAESVAAQLGISEVAADLLPEDNRSYIQRLAAAHRIVAMLGDGINDAPTSEARRLVLAHGRDV